MNVYKVECGLAKYSGSMEEMGNIQRHSVERRSFSGLYLSESLEGALEDVRTFAASRGYDDPRIDGIELLGRVVSTCVPDPAIS